MRYHKIFENKRYITQLKLIILEIIYSQIHLTELFYGILRKKLKLITYMIVLVTKFQNFQFEE